MKFFLLQIVKNTKKKIKTCYKKMKILKFYNTNMLRVLTNGFHVKFYNTNLLRVLLKL